MINKITTFLLLFFVFSFLFRTDTSFDQDLGRHIKLGEIISKSWQVPKTNLFSYTNPDFPFINTHWGFEVLAYLFKENLQILLLLKVVIFLFSVWLIFKIIPQEKRVLLLPVGFIFLHVLRERLELRPEIFSFLFTVSTYYILEKYLKTKTKLIYLLPIIQFFWINTHIYFFVGLVLQVIFLIHLSYKYLRLHLEGVRLKLLGIIFILSVSASVLNPNALAGVLYPLSVTKNYGYTIVENQTLFLLQNIGFADPNFPFVKASWAILVFSLIWAVIKRRFELKDILLALFGLSLSLLNVRSFPYLVFLTLPAVLINLPNIKFKKIGLILSFITCVLLLYESYFYLNGDYYKYKERSEKVGLSFEESGKGALDFVTENNLPQPIFNNFDIGSYIIYRGHPEYKVFVDGRPEAYPAEFFTNTYIPTQYGYNKFKDLDKQINFKTVIFSHTDQTPWGKAFLQNVIKDETWNIVYIDDFMLVLVKKEHLGDLKPIDLAELNTKDFNFNNHVSYLRMGIFLLNTENKASASQFLKEANQLFPQSPVLTGKKNGFFW